MSHSWHQLLKPKGWRCQGCGKLSNELVPDHKGCMSPMLLQPNPPGPHHVWKIENKDGRHWWECCDCGLKSYDDLPNPTHGCKGVKP